MTVLGGVAGMSRDRLCDAFSLAQAPLALHTPGIARRRAVAAHDAMAGNGNRDGVRRAGARHRAHRLRRADPVGDLRISDGRAGRNFLQGLPDALLEGRAADVERQVDAARRRLDETHDPRDQLLEGGIAADELRLREAVLKIAGRT